MRPSKWQWWTVTASVKWWRGSAILHGTLTFTVSAEDQPSANAAAHRDLAAIPGVVVESFTVEGGKEGGDA